ncbi:MAG: cysteine desulfurase [Alkaliphilus sp.]|nr:cysteine desulfurase [Alkaliphilus sp.]
MVVYFDNSATTKPSQKVVEIMMKALTEYYGNPSSLHRMGLETEKLIRLSRKQVSKALGAKEQEIIFTSGGTEANNLSILGVIEALKRKGKSIITTKIEHLSVLNIYKYLEQKGFKVLYLDVDQYGRINMEQLKNSVTEETIMITIMHVNNEVGTIQPVEDIGDFIRDRASKPIFHVDAVQSFGKVHLRSSRIMADFISLSGHKIHGPKGIGALYIKKGQRIQPLVFGGNQETGLRSGTENVPGILGFGVAAEEITNDIDNRILKMRTLKESFVKMLKSEIGDIKINGSEGEGSSPHITNISFMGVMGEVLLHSLEQDNIFVSTGSACSSKKEAKSHVLKAMGMKDSEIESAIRFSFSHNNTIEEMNFTIDRLKKHVSELRKIRKR